jgi:hypothetical protein
MHIRTLLAPAALLLSFMLGGCDLLGIEPASALAARKEAEGKAVGGACRHSGRAIEDCYLLNKRADKAAVFSGWREMNDYMRENKIESVSPQVVSASAPPKPEGEEEQADAQGTAADKGDKADKPPRGKADKAEKPAAKKAAAKH